MSCADITAVLDRQLLLQLGDRLRGLRESRGLGTVEMAQRVGIDRKTLRSVETGDPSTSIGTYVRVMSLLGVSGELALLGGGALQPPSSETTGTRGRRGRPVVEVKVSLEPGRHQLQDLQSLALHEEAVRQVKADPSLAHQAEATLERWLQKSDSRSHDLWLEWREILATKAWRKILGRTRRAQQLRQASPLVTVLPEDIRQRILAQANQLKEGIVLGAQA